MPPYIIYKGSEKSVPLGWISNGPIGAGYNTTKNGWMDQNCFKAWVGWFNIHLENRGIEKPVVLFMDGSTTHISLAIVEQARECNILLVKLLPNSTHMLQALDVGVFGPCKKNWKLIIRKWIRQIDFEPVTKKVFPALFSELYDDMVKNPQNLISGFRAAGQWPFNKDLILNKVKNRNLSNSIQ